MASTGNGFKAGLTGSVKTATTNFYLAKGGISQEELFSQMGNGLFITSLMGLHSGCNAVSGDFSLSAEGFRVENGKLGQPVEQITIAGNFYHLLEAVEEIADDDLPAVEILIDAAVANAKPAVIDAMTAKEAWRTDIPGSPVKDIRSAISLHDRILFINGLFGEDPILFQEVLTAINSMTSVDEVVGYLAEKRPDWDMNSDSVYRFMMAVRRRIQ